MILNDSIERLLLIAPSWIGDAVMASVVYRAARSACPNATITIAGRPTLRPLLDGAPWFDQVESIESKGLFGPLQAGRRLSIHRPDAVVLLPGSFRSALVARCSGASCRIGTARDARRLLLTHPLPHPDRARPISAVEHYARIAEASFGTEAAVDRTMSLHICEAEQQDAERLLGGDDRPLLLLVPARNRADKRWPVERFAEAANTLARSHGLRIVVCGGSRGIGTCDIAHFASAGRHHQWADGRRRPRVLKVLAARPPSSSPTTPGHDTSPQPWVPHRQPVRSHRPPMDHTARRSGMRSAGRPVPPGGPGGRSPSTTMCNRVDHRERCDRSRRQTARRVDRGSDLNAARTTAMRSGPTSSGSLRISACTRSNILYTAPLVDMHRLTPTVSMSHGCSPSSPRSMMMLDSFRSRCMNPPVAIREMIPPSWTAAARRTDTSISPSRSMSRAVHPSIHCNSSCTVRPMQRGPETTTGVGTSIASRRRVPRACRCAGHADRQGQQT